MNRLNRPLMALILAMVTLTARADVWVQGTIAEIHISTSGNGTDMILVKGSFANGCTEGGFFLVATDTFFKETYATLLAAKLSGTPVKYLHSYCHTNGFGRGNGYTITN